MLPLGLSSEAQIVACPAQLSALPALFAPEAADAPALWAVLEGRHTGQALVDSVQTPTQCVLRTDATLTFASPEIQPKFLAAALARLRTLGPVWLIWPPAPASPLPPPTADQVFPRLEFYDYDPASPTLAAWRRRLPAGAEIRPLDRPLLERCEWREEIEFFCGSLDNFLAHNFGLCLVRGDEILVEAYTSSIGAGKAEIGAITRAAWRGQGYAPVACAHLLQACEQRGLQAIWSCDTANAASIRVARKLGFRMERPYFTLEYSKK